MALLIDVIRLTSPTHIIRMVPERPRVFDPITDFLPLTPHTLTSGTGVVTSSTHVVPSSVEEEWYSENIVGLRGEVCVCVCVCVCYTVCAPHPAPHLVSPLQWSTTLPDKEMDKEDHSLTTPDHSDTELTAKRIKLTTEGTTEGTKLTTGETKLTTGETTGETKLTTGETTGETTLDSSSDEEDHEMVGVGPPPLATPPVGGARRRKFRRSNLSSTGLCVLIPEPTRGNGAPHNMAPSGDVVVVEIARDDDVMVATINRSLGRGGATADWTVGQGIASSDDITQIQGTLKKEVG